MPNSSEYDAACNGAALFDLSARGKIELAGPDARLFLHNLCTNDVKDLPVGAGCEAFLCTTKARVVAHVLVGHYHVGDRDVLWLDTEPGLAEKLLKHLDHYLISERVQLADRTSEMALWRLCGPKAKTILQEHLGAELPELAEWHHVARPLGFIRRQAALTVPGYDLFCPAPDAPGLCEALLALGATPASNETHDVLRVEAGTPVYGIDMDEERFVVELGRTKQAISYSKGCYLGQEPIVMARDRGHANRTLLGIKVAPGHAAGNELAGSQAPVPRGARLFQDDAEVGQVTSSVFSPRLGQVIALAYLKRGSQQPDTILTIETESDGRQAVVSSLPFLPFSP